MTHDKGKRDEMRTTRRDPSRNQNENNMRERESILIEGIIKYYYFL